MKTAATVLKCQNTLGEGVLWNHLRQEVMWFDIVARKFFTYHPATQTTHRISFPVMVSGAMLTPSSDVLLLASERGIEHFSFTTHKLTLVRELEPSLPHNRSNDVKGAPDGSFFVSTMDKNGNQPSGSIYRIHYRPPTTQNTATHPQPLPALDPATLKNTLQVDVLVKGLTIPNSMCFHAATFYYTDTPTQQIYACTWQQADGAPPALHHRLTIDTQAFPGNPDGSTCDQTGKIWNARWGAGCVSCFTPQGNLLKSYPLPAQQVSCVAWGGKPLQTLYITTARQGYTTAQLQHDPLAKLAGALFALDFTGTPFHGTPEPLFASANTPNSLS